MPAAKYIGYIGGAAVAAGVGAAIAVLCWKLSGWLIRSRLGPFAKG